MKESEKTGIALFMAHWFACIVALSLGFYTCVCLSSIAKSLEKLIEVFE